MSVTGPWSARRDRFRALHETGLFVMPNPMDIGSARLLASMGFPALATTSSGFAASLGRTDYGVRRDELLAHVGALASAVDVPLNVDAERCFGDDPRGRRGHGRAAREGRCIGLLDRGLQSRHRVHRSTRYLRATRRRGGGGPPATMVSC